MNATHSRMGLVGRKVGMTQVFHDDGSAIGCTAIAVGPCTVTGKRTAEKHGYSALQIGFEITAAHRFTRPERGYLRRLDLPAFSVLRELRLEAAELDAYKVGDVLSAPQVFKVGDVVDVVGTTKGKGYQGVMKKHRMRGDSATHGTHEFFRHGGSIGCRITPGRVHKGKRMSGRMGAARATSSNLVVVKVLPERDLVLVKGAVPGPAGGLVVLRGSVKDVRRYIVPRAIEQAESKNPMKASKKGA